MQLLKIMRKAIRLILYCTVASFRHPLSKHITCTFTNPGTVTTSALPWIVSASFIALGFGGIIIGELCKLSNVTLYSSNMLTAGTSWIGGMVTQGLKKKE